MARRVKEKKKEEDGRRRWLKPDVRTQYLKSHRPSSTLYFSKGWHPLAGRVFFRFRCADVFNFYYVYGYDYMVAAHFHPFRSPPWFVFQMKISSWSFYLSQMKIQNGGLVEFNDVAMNSIQTKLLARQSTEHVLSWWICNIPIHHRENAIELGGLTGRRHQFFSPPLWKNSIDQQVHN